MPPTGSPPWIGEIQEVHARRLAIAAVEHCTRWTEVAVSLRERLVGDEVAPESATAQVSMRAEDLSRLGELEIQSDRWGRVLAVAATALGGDELGDRERPAMWIALGEVQLETWGAPTEVRSLNEVRPQGSSRRRRAAAPGQSTQPVSVGGGALLQALEAPGVRHWWQALSLFSWMVDLGFECLGELRFDGSREQLSGSTWPSGWPLPGRQGASGAGPDEVLERAVDRAPDRALDRGLDKGSDWLTGRRTLQPGRWNLDLSLSAQDRLG